MKKTVQVENAGMVREVDMYDKKKGDMDLVGKVKPTTDKAPGNKSHDKNGDAEETINSPKSDNQNSESNDTDREADHHKKRVKRGKERDMDSESDLNEPAAKDQDDDENFRFNEVEQPISSRKGSQDQTGDKKKLMETVRDVENRLKGREQINLTMMSIEVANLPSAHRFTKNCPWLKGSYGTTYSWVAEYEERDDGTRAAWKNMRWSFNLERNDKDRNDLVITVCSKNLILGRYVLGKHEFSDIPDTKTGYFEVSGDIMSSIGPAGKIRILFLRGKAERPKGPMKPVLSAQINPANAPVSQFKQAAALQKRAYVKVLSAAVMDLKSVHFLDVNCPFIAVEVGDWVGISDTAHNACMAARWNSLNWKFTVTADVGVHLMIHSKNVLIGRMHVSLEEITNTTPKSNNIIEIIKHITDGKDVTGKVKMNLLAESPLPEERVAVEDKTAVHAGELKTLDADGNEIENGEDPVNEDGDNNAGGDSGEGGEGVGQAHSTSSPNAGKLQSVNGRTLGSYPGAGDLAPLKPFMRVPFQINVHEVTLLDTVKAQYFRNNALAVNVVCGSWGKATDELKNSGSFAHWIDMKWKIPVKGSNNLRITAWSHGKPIGSANITIAELLDMPTDYEHNTEIFAKLTNSTKDIVGKVKLTCKYESLISVINDKIVAISKGGESPESRAVWKTNDFQPNVGVEKRTVNFEEEGGEDDFDDEFGYSATQPVRLHQRGRQQELNLPIVATIKTISVYDAIPVHTFKRNAPYIKFICDRKSATTEAVKNAGAVASWPGLNWIMKIREDSHVVAMLLSGDVLIGRVEFNPKDLLHIPLNDEGLTEIKTLFRKDNTTTAKLHMVADLKSLEDIPGYDGSLTAPNTRGSNSNFMRRGGPPLYGNTAGGLDGVSMASYGGTLPQLSPQYTNQFPQPTPMFTPPGFNAGSFYGGMQSQRIPTLPSATSAAAMRQSFSAGGAYSNPMYNTMGSNNNIDMNNAFNIYSPNSRQNQPYFDSPEGRALDQGSLTWGNSMLLQQQRFVQQQQQPGGQLTIFDRNLMSADNARKLGLAFNLNIQEIDLIDLKSVHSFAKNCPFVSAACGKWTAATEAIQNAGDTAFWTKLNWRSTCKSGGNLRLIVNSKKIVMGSVNFSTEDMLNAISDDKGLRRVNGKIISENNELNGRIKVAYTMDVVTNNQIDSPQQGGMSLSGKNGFSPGASFSASQSVRGGGSTNGYLQQNTTATPLKSQRVPSLVPKPSPQSPQYPFDMGDDSYYDELIDPDPRKHVEFPFNIHIIELSTLDLLSVHQLKRNQPVIKAFCDTFYSETKIVPEYADVTYFKELNWVFPVKERSIFKITVCSRDKDIGSTLVDLIAMKDIPFDQNGLREMVVSVHDERGRAAGKVRMIVKLSNVAINDYDYRNSLDNEQLGMDGVSVPGTGGPQSVSYRGGGADITGGTSSSKKRTNASNAPMSVFGGASVAGSAQGVSYGKDFEYLLQSQVEATNELASVALLRCTLTGIAVIDLRSVHTFKPNSPSVNIACGKVIATTRAAENAGKMANWEDMNIEMPVDRSSTLRVLISSGDKVIGQCSVNRGKLLGGRKNAKGSYVLFGELENAGKLAGKIKFVYTLMDPAAPATAAGAGAVGGSISMR